MQRLLVGLVLFLLVAVGGLAIWVVDLSDNLTVTSRHTAYRPARGSLTEPDGDVAEMEALRKRLDKALRELASLRRQQNETARALARAARSGGSAKTDKKDGEDYDPKALARAKLQADGVAVSEEDEAWYIAVKESVDRKRRIQGQFANMMRRIDRLSENNNIQPIPDQHRKQVEKAILRFVTSADTILTDYIRKPSEQLKALPADQRREAMRVDRDEAVRVAQQALQPLLGDQDASEIVDRTLKSRRVMRNRGTFNRRRG